MALIGALTWADRAAQPSRSMLSIFGGPGGGRAGDPKSSRAGRQATGAARLTTPLRAPAQTAGVRIGHAEGTSAWRVSRSDRSRSLKDAAGLLCHRICRRRTGVRGPRLPFPPAVGPKGLRNPDQTPGSWDTRRGACHSHSPRLRTGEWLRGVGKRLPRMGSPGAPGAPCVCAGRCRDRCVWLDAGLRPGSSPPDVVALIAALRGNGELLHVVRSALLVRGACLWGS